MVAPRQPTNQECEALVQFAGLEISLEDLCSRLQDDCEVLDEVIDEINELALL